MSFETRGRTPVGRCTLCSLGCEVQLEEYALRSWRPVPTCDQNGRMCARGQMLGDLLGQPARVYRAKGRSGEVRTSEVLRGLAERLRRRADGGGRLVVWLDGNVAVEDLAAAHAYCLRRDGPTRLLVHLPPHELGAVEGLDIGGVPQTAPSFWPLADAFLVVGNPLATHPPTASRLMRWGRERADTPMVVIDSAPGVVGGFAQHKLLCRPGYEYWVVTAVVVSAGLDAARMSLPEQSLLRRIIHDSGVQAERIDRAAEQLRSAHHPAVVIAPASGSAERWRALSATAAGWVKQRKGMASVLTGSANALAVSRYARQHGIASWAENCNEGEGEPNDLLLVIGFDPSSGYPQGGWQPAVKRSREVIFAGAFPPFDDRWADWIVPMAIPGAEVGGTYVFADGQRHRVDPLMAPPTGALSVRDLFGDLATEEAARGSEHRPEKVCTPAIRDEDLMSRVGGSSLEVPSAPILNGNGGWPVVLIADPVQYFDGQMTRHARWIKASKVLPELHVSPADAATMGMKAGQIVKLVDKDREALVRLAVARDQPEVGGCLAERSPRAAPAGWLAVSGCFSEVRRLASWRFDHADEPTHSGTIGVRVEPAPMAGSQET